MIKVITSSLHDKYSENTKAAELKKELDELFKGWNNKRIIKNLKGEF